MKTIFNRLYVYVPLMLVAVLQNSIHESIHYVTARMFGENVLEFRLLTNGWLTSQVVYATPMEQRSEFHWLAIAWSPAIVTTLIGFIVYVNRARLITPFAPLNLGIWYVGVLFMTIDPVYFGILSWFMERSDVNAAEIFGWSAVPFQIIALLVSVAAIRLVLNWRQEARSDLHRYRLSTMEIHPNQ
jgi:hypothetical protein